MTRRQGSPIRFALIGCGRVAAKHLSALDALDGVELVAVCDVEAERAAAVAQRYDVPGVGELEALLQVSFDVGVLATPTGLHAAQARALAEAGRHVVCEKPMANRLGDARAMIDAFEQAGRRLFVVKQLRYNPTLRLLRRALREGWLGPVHMVNLDVFWTRPQAYFDQAAWRGTRALDGGALLNQTSHYFDLLTWLFGPVSRVSGQVATRARDIEVEDSGVVHLSWESGALGAVAITLLTYPENLEARMVVAGERGTVVLGGRACDRVDVWRVQGSPVSPEEVAQINRATRARYGRGHLDYYANVLEVLDGGGQPDTDGREGLRSLELISAIYESSRRGEQVELPLAVGGEPR